MPEDPTFQGGAFQSEVVDGDAYDTFQGITSAEAWCELEVRCRIAEAGVFEDVMGDGVAGYGQSVEVDTPTTEVADLVARMADKGGIP